MTTTPGLFIVTSTPGPAPAAAYDKFPANLLLVFMILLLPCIAVLVGVFIWIIRRIRVIPKPDVELSTPHSASRKGGEHPGLASVSSVSSNTAQLPPLPKVSHVQGDRSEEKIDLTGFSPTNTSTLRGLPVALRGSSRSHELDITDTAVSQALSSFRISPLYASSKSRESVLLVIDRYPTAKRL